ncbi:MAG: DNA polymerase III subunit beta [Porcipelethomonas sp.]
MSIKFNCKKEDITAAIGNVSKAVSQKSTISALEGIKLRLDSSQLELTGYDLEIGITTSIGCTSSDSGEIILNSRLFSEITRRMPSEIISYEVDENLNLKISGGNAEYQISAIGAEEYPALPEIEMENPVSVNQAVLRSMINQTVYAVSVNDAKPIMTGELFDIENNSFNIVAIDGFRLAIRNENTEYQEKKHFVVPSKALKEAAALLSEEDDKKCLIYVNAKHVLFDINGYRIFTRLLEGEFHNYKNSVPVDFKTEVLIKTSDIIHCLERCALLLNDKNKAPVKCKFENNNIFLECKTAIGRLDDSIEAEISGESVTIGFNNKFLLEALRACDTDKVRIQMNGPSRAVKIIPLEGSHFTFIVMPVQIRS